MRDAVPEPSPPSPSLLSRAPIALAAVVAILGISWLDGVTGEDVGLSILYLVPVIALGWLDLRAGLLGAVLAVGAFVASDQLWWNHHSPIGAALQGGFRLAVFALLASATARIRRDRDTQRRLAEQLQLLLNHADRLATTGKLASGIAHELGTPLNVVAGRAKLIASGGLTAAELSDNARIISEQTARMTRIIRQLLDFSRRGAGHRVPHDVRALVRRALDMLGKLAERAKVSLTLEEGTDEVDATVDPIQLEQVVTNVVVNALDSIADGGRVTVRVTRERARRPEGGPPADAVCIAVTDTGQGIASADLPRIFEPFFTTKEVGVGTGLGLSVAHGIVLDHGGWFGVDSEVGRGTTFRIYLPQGSPASGPPVSTP